MTASAGGDATAAPAQAAYEAEFVPEWDVFRDEAGNPVTITWQQVQAVWNAVRVVNAVREAEGQRSLWDGPPEAEMAKSRLLGRMLVEGKPPTRTRPPLSIGGPAWHLLPGGDPFDAERQASCERDALAARLAGAQERLGEETAANGRLRELLAEILSHFAPHCADPDCETFEAEVSYRDIAGWDQFAGITEGTQDGAS